MMHGREARNLIAMMLCTGLAVLCSSEHWVHYRYDHIGNLDLKSNEGVTQVKCYVTEKAHGANLCLITDGDTVRYG